MTPAARLAGISCRGRVMNSGGSAFPVCPPLNEHGREADNYPFEDGGMTLLDYFAGKALVGVLYRVAQGIPYPTISADACAEEAYDLAAAMLRVRAKRGVQS